MRQVWDIPKIWNMETAFILGGGPSLADVNFELIKHRKIIAVNNAYGDPVGENGNRKYISRDWVDVCFFGDERWYGWHKIALKNFKGMLVTCRSNLHGKGNGQVLGVHRGAAEGFESRSNYLAWNKSSGGCAIDLAHHLGATTCVLLGFDMRRVEDRANWHEDHSAPNKNPYEKFLYPMSTVAVQAARLKFKIINCTPDSALRCFPMMPLEEFLNNEKV